MFQSRYGNDPFLLEQCLKSLLAFFLTGDNKSRRHAFYVVNDLVQVRVKRSSFSVPRRNRCCRTV